MASAIGLGDWVEAFKGLRAGGGDDFGFRKGGIYRVSELLWVAPCSCGDVHPGLNFHGMRRDPNGYAGCQFRPIYRPKRSIIEALKAPVVRAPLTAKPKSREAA